MSIVFDKVWHEGLILKLKACVRYFLKIHYTDLITQMNLQQQTMSTCVITPRKPKLYVAMADASSKLLLQVKQGQQFSQKKITMRNKLNDVQAFPDQIKSVLHACSEGKLSWMHFHFASNKAHL